MISYQEALEHLSKVQFAQPQARVPLIDAVDLALAEPLIARIPSPPFTNSAMDGFAVRAADVRAGNPLPVIGTRLAGPTADDLQSRWRPGSCIRIMTGAEVPEWADAVIPVEQTAFDEAGGTVTFRDAPTPGANVRRAGEDLAAGQVAVARGLRLTPERLMVAAALGYAEVPVHLPPRVCIRTTGDELAEPAEDLRPGMVYNSSKYFLLSSAKRLLGSAVDFATLADRADEAAGHVSGLLEGERPLILITTGAVSAGVMDFIPQVGERLGFRAVFHKVAIRPGKPVYFGVRKNAVWLGLPGNPVSACVGWHFFARPLLAAAGCAAPAARCRLKLANEVRKPAGLRAFYRAEVTGDKAWVFQRQGSAELAASAQASAYVELPESQDRLAVDTVVDALIL